MDHFKDLRPVVRVPKQRSVVHSPWFVGACLVLNLILFFIGYKAFYKPDPDFRPKTKLLYKAIKPGDRE